MPTTYAIIKGNQYFDSTLYTGTGANATIVNSGAMQPDFVWVKVRSTTGTHVLTDSVRGANKQLFSNLINAEASATNKITGFTSTGFTLGADDGSGTGDANFSGSTYVGWQWRANGAAVTNNAGSITSSVSASTTAGFSIVTYTGNQAIATVGHGLSAAPKMIIIKNRSTSDNNWMVYTEPTGASNYLRLNLTNASTSTSLWNNTAPTSSVFSLIADSDVNGSGANYVAYCWSEVPGFSKIGSYVGNGNADGTFVYTGFEPRYIMAKRTDTTANWTVYDTSRSPSNQVELHLRPNTNQADDTGTSEAIDILSNGFKLRGTSTQTNASGGTYVYMAFAEMPTKYANAR
jgi:hypothetical protein